MLLKESTIALSMGESLKLLFTNRNYMFLFITFNFLYGLYSAISGVISSFTTPYDYLPSDISVMCLAFLLAGILNSFFIGILLDKYQCYKKALVTISICSIVALSLSLIGLPSKKVILESAVLMITGASVIPVVTISFSFAAELSYPVPESYSIGVMISVA